MRSRLSRGVAIAALAVGISVVAFAGISLAGSSGGGATGQSAQAPLGERSARFAPGGGGGVENQVASGGENPGATNSPGSGSANAPVQTTGGGSKSLPFTGLLVVPVLLVGLALLGTGLVLRRRDLSTARP